LSFYSFLEFISVFKGREERGEREGWKGREGGREGTGPIPTLHFSHFEPDAVCKSILHETYLVMA